eukprot:TRINITY_DN2159_c0_g2_i1.p1 TRINITY_DN2159_c0_g2~~TRINITY_DN2159_c0_g2_i1.p1  ORF type:complete len:600 (+),score=140.71 TRINITY_DN2159_c0_g2_i1:184-1983(+)
MALLRVLLLGPVVASAGEHFNGLVDVSRPAYAWRNARSRSSLSMSTEAPEAEETTAAPVVEAQEAATTTAAARAVPTLSAEAKLSNWTSEEAEAKLAELFANPSAEVQKQAEEANGLRMATARNGDPSVLALVDHLEVTKPQSDTLSHRAMRGDWRLEYASELPRAIRDHLALETDGVVNLSVTRSQGRFGPMETKVGITLASGEERVVKLNSILKQSTRHSRFFMSVGPDNNTEKTEVTYMSNDLLITRIINEEDDRRNLYVWRKLEGDAAAAPAVAPAPAALWRFGPPFSKDAATKSQGGTGEKATKSWPLSAFGVVMLIAAAMIAAIASILLHKRLPFKMSSQGGLLDDARGMELVLTPQDAAAATLPSPQMRPKDVAPVVEAAVPDHHQRYQEAVVERAREAEAAVPEATHFAEVPVQQGGAWIAPVAAAASAAEPTEEPEQAKEDKNEAPKEHESLLAASTGWAASLLHNMLPHAAEPAAEPEQVEAVPRESATVGNAVPAVQAAPPTSSAEVPKMQEKGKGSKKGGWQRMTSPRGEKSGKSDFAGKAGKGSWKRNTSPNGKGGKGKDSGKGKGKSKGNNRASSQKWRVRGDDY